MAAGTKTATKGTTTRIKVSGKKSEKVTLVQAFRAGDAKRKEGDKEKKTALKSLLAIAPHGEQVIDPADGTTWQVVNEAYDSEPKASAWDALMAGSILTPKQRAQAEALFKALSKPDKRQNLKQL